MNTCGLSRGLNNSELFAAQLWICDRSPLETPIYDGSSLSCEPILFCKERRQERT